MQRKIGTEIELGSSYDSIGASYAIDRTASNYTDAGDKGKLENSSKQVRMMLTSLDTYQVL